MFVVDKKKPGKNPGFVFLTLGGINLLPILR